MLFVELVKPEIVFASIEKAISLGQRVGFIIPRREVVKEIYDRLKKVYPTLNISCVYGGHSEYLDGDIICLTAHQSFRYQYKFGLVILDEFDAFPLKGDEILLNIVKKTSYNKIIYLSATFSKEFLKDKNYVSLNRRHHSFDIPIPKCKILPKFLHFFCLFNFIHKHKNKPLFIFVPTVKKSIILSFLLKINLIKNVSFTSRSKNKNLIFAKIKSGEIKTIVCTTILERGITVEELNVIVYQANDRVFDKSTLIQISGRVGRKSSCPTGEVLFISNKESYAMKECIKSIYEKNCAYS